MSHYHLSQTKIDDVFFKAHVQATLFFFKNLHVTHFGFFDPKTHIEDVAFEFGTCPSVSFKPQKE